MSNIYQSLAAVMADVGHVAKRDRNEQQRFLFRGIDAVVNAVGPALRKHRVIVTPTVETIDYTERPTRTGGVAVFCRVTVTYTFWAEDGTSLACRVAGESFDTGDKSTAKAMSVAFRTALLQALTLPTDEPDPDQYTYEPPTGTQVPAHRGEPVPRLPEQQRAALFAMFTRKGVLDPVQQRAGIEHTIGRRVEHRDALTEEEFRAVITALEELPDAAQDADAVTGESVDV